jgi:hypothetical protein
MLYTHAGSHQKCSFFFSSRWRDEPGARFGRQCGPFDSWEIKVAVALGGFGGLKTPLRGCIQHFVCFASLNFTSPINQPQTQLMPQLEAVETPFGNEFDPSSVAPD